MGNLLEDQPDAKGKLEVTGGPMTERGSFGIVERAEDHLQIERFAAPGNRDAVFGLHRDPRITQPLTSVNGDSLTGVGSPARLRIGLRSPRGLDIYDFHIYNDIGNLPKN